MGDDRSKKLKNDTLFLKKTGTICISEVTVKPTVLVSVVFH